MKVYVLNRDFSYEGETTLGVFATREGAVARARTDDCCNGSKLKEWKPDRWSERDGVIPVYVVREMEVEA